MNISRHFTTVVASGCFIPSVYINSSNNSRFRITPCLPFQSLLLILDTICHVKARIHFQVILLCFVFISKQYEIFRDILRLQLLLLVLSLQSINSSNKSRFRITSCLIFQSLLLILDTICHVKARILLQVIHRCKYVV